MVCVLDFAGAVHRSRRRGQFLIVGVCVQKFMVLCEQDVEIVKVYVVYMDEIYFGGAERILPSFVLLGGACERINVFLGFVPLLVK